MLYKPLVAHMQVTRWNALVMKVNLTYMFETFKSSAGLGYG